MMCDVHEKTGLSCSPHEGAQQVKHLPGINRDSLSESVQSFSNGTKLGLYVQVRS